MKNKEKTGAREDTEMEERKREQEMEKRRESDTLGRWARGIEPAVAATAGTVLVVHEFALVLSRLVHVLLQLILVITAIVTTARGWRTLARTTCSLLCVVNVLCK